MTLNTASQVYVAEYFGKLAGCQILLCAIIAIRQGMYFIWTLGVNAIQFWCATETANLSYEKIYQLETEECQALSIK